MAPKSKPKYKPKAENLPDAAKLTHFYGVVSSSPAARRPLPAARAAVPPLSAEWYNPEDAEQTADQTVASMQQGSARMRDGNMREKPLRCLFVRKEGECPTPFLGVSNRQSTGIATCNTCSEVHRKRLMRAVKQSGQATNVDETTEQVAKRHAAVRQKETEDAIKRYTKAHGQEKAAEAMDKRKQFGETKVVGVGRTKIATAPDQVNDASMCYGMDKGIVPATGNKKVALSDRARAIMDATSFSCPVIRCEGGPACGERDPLAIMAMKKWAYLGLKNVEMCGACWKWVMANATKPETTAFKDCKDKVDQLAPNSYKEYADWINKQPGLEREAHGAEVAKLLAEHLPKGERPAWGHIAPHLLAGGDAEMATSEECAKIRVAIDKLADAKFEWDEMKRKEQGHEEQG